ncbi:FAD/NAD(P)-binding domain-containing protein [Xylariaceae sp. FL1651]|nr:FAD/NAD(P)-binding domain-containing protein [Xylariaceae sp. FL1651]
MNGCHALLVPGNASTLASLFHYAPVTELGTPYRVLSQYHSELTKLRVTCMGAGASGLCLACEMIPSPPYTFSWDPKPDWSHDYAYNGEIRRCFEDFAKQYGSEKYMKLNAKVVEGRWNEEKGVWHIIMKNGITKATWQDWCHRLDHSVDFKAKDLKVFMQSPTWISPPFRCDVFEEDVRKNGAGGAPGNRQRVITGEMKPRISPRNEELKFIFLHRHPLIFGGVKKIAPEDIISENSTTSEVFILVYAIGFSIASRPAFKLINAEGKTLDEGWGDGANLCFDVSTPRLPNYYTIVMMKKAQHENIR